MIYASVTARRDGVDDRLMIYLEGRCNFVVHPLLLIPVTPPFLYHYHSSPPKHLFKNRLSHRNFTQPKPHQGASSNTLRLVPSLHMTSTSLLHHLHDLSCTGPFLSVRGRWQRRQFGFFLVMNKFGEGVERRSRRRFD